MRNPSHELAEAGSKPAILRAMVLMHPSQDSCSPAEITRELEDRLPVESWSLEIVTVGSAAELDAAARQARDGGYDIVLVAGGDGTVSRVARQLIGSGVLLGIIPVGRENNISIDLGIPQDSAQAIALLTGEHEVHHVDALRVGTEHFFLQVGTAAPTQTSAPLAADDATRLGNDAVPDTGPSGFRSRRFSLHVDGKHYRVSAWQVILINTGGLRSMAFRSGMANFPSDHVAELVVVRVRSTWALLRAGFHLSGGRRDAGISISYVQVKHDALIAPDQPMPVQGDGESVGSTPVHAFLVADAVKVIGAKLPKSMEESAVPGPTGHRHRGHRRFRTELMRHLGPLGALDAALFLAVSRLPHPPYLNLLSQAIEAGMGSGQGWVAGVSAANIRHWSRLWREELNFAPILWLTSASTEFPIKRIFARQRPFMSLVLTPVVGRKPSSHSFPSGHSASAFAGAWLLSRKHPRWAGAFYAFAALVGFSRVYQGHHYPSDVVIGAVTGTMLAAAYGWTLGRILSRVVRLSS